MQHDKLKRKREIFDILSTEIFEFSSDQILLIFVILWEQTAKVSGSEQKNLNNNKFLPLHSSLLVSVLALVLIAGCLNEILFPSKCGIGATVFAIETCLAALQRFVYFLTTSLHTLNNFSTSPVVSVPTWFHHISVNICGKILHTVPRKNRNISLTCQKGIRDLEQNIPTVSNDVSRKEYNIRLRNIRIYWWRSLLSWYIKQSGFRPHSQGWEEIGLLLGYAYI